MDSKLKGEMTVKKILIILIISMFVAGCSAEWYKHDTIYKNHDHMFFSWWGYQDTSAEDFNKSENQGWWGDEIPYIPAE